MTILKLIYIQSPTSDLAYKFIFKHMRIYVAVLYLSYGSRDDLQYYLIYKPETFVQEFPKLKNDSCIFCVRMDRIKQYFRIIQSFDSVDGVDVNSFTAPEGPHDSR